MEEQVRQEKNKSKESYLNEKQVESKESLRFQWALQGVPAPSQAAT